MSGGGDRRRAPGGGFRHGYRGPCGGPFRAAGSFPEDGPPGGGEWGGEPGGGWRHDPLTVSPNPHRLYRDPDHGVIFGVCAGLAAFFGLQAWQVRAAAVLCLVVSMPLTILAYLVLAAILPRRPARLYRNPEEEAFWRHVSGAPGQTLSALRFKFREFEERIAGMERTVTSSEFKLDREIRNLDH